MSRSLLGVSAGAQLLCRAEPIFVGRSVRTAPSLPQFISEGRYVGMSECGDAVSNGSFVGIVLRMLGVLLSLPRLFMSTQVFLLSLLLGHAMRVRGAVFQLGGPLMILIVRCVVIASGHMS
jgi:hypothetical protein